MRLSVSLTGMDSDFFLILFQGKKAVACVKSSPGFQIQAPRTPTFFVIYLFFFFFFIQVVIVSIAAQARSRFGRPFT